MNYKYYIIQSSNRVFGRPFRCGWVSREVITHPQTEQAE